MSTLNKPNRRDFLKITSLTGGGLVLGFSWFGSEAAPVIINTTTADLNFNSYLSIATDGTITIFSPNPELGQNVMTSFPMIVAEELDADWSQVKAMQAPLDKKFDRQLTGGSGAIPHSWKRLRTAGASAKYLLIAAAAKRWNVDASECTASNSVVTHTKTGKKLTYGELAEEASKLTVPARSEERRVGKECRSRWSTYH